MNQIVFKHWQLTLKCGLLIIGCWSVVYADDMDVNQQIKLSFIYNFAKFVTFPNASSATTPFVMCVIGTQPLSSKIILLENKKVNEQPISVRLLTKNKITTDCKLLFVSESEAEHLQDILLPLANQPVLTVSTIADFTDAGGMIGLKELDNRQQFDINLMAAKKAGLAISSQLLKLADEIIQ